MATGQQLQQAYELIKGGHKEHAASLLSVWLAADPCNADAWWLMALAAPSQDLMRRALVRLLELRPDDVRARQLLDSLSVRRMLADARLASAEVKQAQRPAFPAAGMEPRLPRLRSRQQGQRNASSRSRGVLLGLFAAAVFGLVGCGVLLLALASGFEWVSRAFDGIQPALSVASAANLPSEAFFLGDINMLGNMGFTQFRTGSLLSLDDRHQYTFIGAEGDWVTFEATTPDSALDPALAVYGEGGLLVGANADRAEDDTDAMLSLVLPYTGTYAVVVGAQNGAGEYRLQLRH